MKNENIIIIFDTNVLLDLYSYKETTLSKVLEYFESIKKYLYIPEQVYKEFVRNYESVRKIKSNKYELFKSQSKKDIYDINETLDKIINKKTTASFDKQWDNGIVDSLKDLLYRFENNIIHNTELILDELPNYTEGKEDIILKFVTEIVKINAYNQYSFQEKLTIVSDSLARFELGIRPGLIDYKNKKNKKQSSDIFHAFGDNLIWYDVLTKTNYKEVIFLQNELKSDWWDNVENNVIASELLEEWKEHSDGKLTFLHLGKYLDSFTDGVMETKELEEINERRFAGFVEDSLNEIRLDMLKIITSDPDKYFTYDSINDQILSEVISGGNIDELDDYEILEVTIPKDGISVLDYDIEDKYINIDVQGDFVIKGFVQTAYGHNKEESGGASHEVEVNFNFNSKVELYISSFINKRFVIQDIKTIITIGSIEDITDYFDEEDEYNKYWYNERVSDNK